jgi:hypothetical protein
VLLTADAANSEMVGEEVTTARNLAREQPGRLLILPVRLAYTAPLPYALRAYLNPIQAAFWRGPEDTSQLIAELCLAIEDKTAHFTSSLHTAVSPGPEPQQFPRPTPLVPLEIPRGTLDPHSTLYIDRATDRVALPAMEHQGGVTVTITAPRQMGKSSLLVRMVDAAIQQGKRAVLLDFQLIDATILQDAPTFFRHFCSWLSDLLDLEDKVDEYWSRPLGPVQLCTRYVMRYLLASVSVPIVLAMDEVETLAPTAFRSDFFSMVRNWHNSRAIAPVWKRLDLVFSTSTEPNLLIENPAQSPFNVGEQIYLTDFTLEQVAELNRLHGSPLSALQEHQFIDLVGGHPYLIRRGLYDVASGQRSAADLLAYTGDAQGPFNDHLRYYLLRLQSRADLIAGMRQVIDHQSCTDAQVFFRLQSAGLVRRDGHVVRPRCQLYADYFREHLRG